MLRKVLGGENKQLYRKEDLNTEIGILSEKEAYLKSNKSLGGKDMVWNAGWFPTYDIRVNGLDEPVALVYKANVRLEEDIMSLNEVMMTGLQGKVAGVSTSKSLRIRGTSSIKKETRTIPVETSQIVNQTSVEFSIKVPYSIISSDKAKSIDMAHYELPADFQYMTIPKMDKTAFLQALVTDWESYNLLEGEANLFFENTFVGKSVLDVKYLSDTLSISLGRDNSVMVSREKQKDFSTHFFNISQ